VGHDRWIDDLRATRADPTALAELLSAELPYDGLQHAGNATLAARVDDADAALAKITTELIDALRARGWDGDDILADTLELDPATSPSKLTPVGVDLEELADALAENAGSEGFLNLRDGQVWTETIIEASRDAGLLEVEFDEPTRWLLVLGQGPEAPYRTMQRFHRHHRRSRHRRATHRRHRRQRRVPPLLHPATELPRSPHPLAPIQQRHPTRPSPRMAR
jgi:hypothetical protein